MWTHLPRGWILKPNRKWDEKTQDIELELTGVAVYSNFATRTDTQKWSVTGIEDQGTSNWSEEWNTRDKFIVSSEADQRS